MLQLLCLGQERCTETLTNIFHTLVKQNFFEISFSCLFWRQEALSSLMTSCICINKLQFVIIRQENNDNKTAAMTCSKTII